MYVRENKKANQNIIEGQALYTSEDLEKHVKAAIEQYKEEEKNNKEHKKSHFDNFTQFNNKYYVDEDCLMSKSPIAYRILRFLINEMDNFNAICCSYDVLIQKFDKSKETIRKAIKLLKDKNFIKIAKTGVSNIYYINSELVWKSWGNQARYAEFSAKVLFTESEQINKKRKKDLKTSKVKTIQPKQKKQATIEDFTEKEN